MSVKATCFNLDKLMCFMAQSRFYCFTSTQFNNWQLFYEHRRRTSPCTHTQTPTYTFISLTIGFRRPPNISSVQNQCPNLHHINNARREQDLWITDSIDMGRINPIVLKIICSINTRIIGLYGVKKVNLALNTETWLTTNTRVHAGCSQQLPGISRSTRERMTSLTITNTHTQPSHESQIQQSWVSRQFHGMT